MRLNTLIDALPGLKAAFLHLLAQAGIPLSDFRRS